LAGFLIIESVITIVTTITFSVPLLILTSIITIQAHIITATVIIVIIFLFLIVIEDLSFAILTITFIFILILFELQQLLNLLWVEDI